MDPPGDGGLGPGQAGDTNDYLDFAFPQPWDAATESPSQELKDERTLDMKVDFHFAYFISK